MLSTLHRNSGKQGMLTLYVYLRITKVYISTLTAVHGFFDLLYSDTWSKLYGLLVLFQRSLSQSPFYSVSMMQKTYFLCEFLEVSGEWEKDNLIWQKKFIIPSAILMKKFFF